MPFQTNAAWTHEVPAFRKWQGRRISVTFRAFALNRQNRSDLSISIAEAKGAKGNLS
jgi:hypothetical protein